MSNPLGFLALGGLGGVIIGLVLGFAVFGLLSGGVPVPYDQNHQQLASSFTVTTSQGSTTLKFISMAPAEFSPNVPLNIFVPHKTYTQSLWTYNSGNDIDVFLHIWGPGDDGKTYLLEFSRSGSDTININGLTHHIEWPSIGDWQTPTMTGIGYSWIWVTMT